MRIILIPFLIMAILSGCASTPKSEGTINIRSDSKGVVTQKTTTWSGPVVADAALAETQTECYKWQTAVANSNKPAPISMGGQNTESILAAALIQSNATMANAMAKMATGNVNPCPAATNSNDVAIDAKRENTKRWGIVGGVVPVVLGIGAGAYVLGKGFDAAGNQIHANNGAIVKAGQGDKSRYTEQTSPYGGIPLEPGEVTPITLGSETDPVIPDLPQCIDGFISTLPGCSCGSYLEGLCG